MLPYGSTPLTYEEWRIIKATCRRAAYERRLAEVDELSMHASLEALRRDDAGDPYEHQEDYPCVGMAAESAVRPLACPSSA